MTDTERSRLTEIALLCCQVYDCIFEPGHLMAAPFYGYLRSLGALK